MIKYTEASHINPELLADPFWVESLSQVSPEHTHDFYEFLYSLKADAGILSTGLPSFFNLAASSSSGPMILITMKLTGITIAAFSIFPAEKASLMMPLVT